jgi:hypothetical protein
VSALGWVDVHDPHSCNADEETFVLSDSRPGRERSPSVSLGRYEGAQCVTVCALVPADEYEAMAADVTRLAAIDALHNLITDGTTGETWCGQCGPGYPCLTRLALNSPVERAEDPIRAHP